MIAQRLRHASPATLKRLLAPARATRPPRGATTTRPGIWLKHQIPLRTFADWDDARPGFLEIDLVAHCGTSTEDFYLHTLCAVVDICTCWVELDAVWGKGQVRVGGAVHHVQERLPIPLRGLDSDNGSEFINRILYDYCQRMDITFTRSRAQLRRVYALARRHVNFFQPVQKLVHKTRHGARVHRVYDRAQTPYQRLCTSGVLSAATHAELAGVYQGLNPLALRRQLEHELERLWTLAAPDPHRAIGPEPSRTSPDTP